MTSPAAPTVLSGRYRLEDELGRGAMGIVYRARDLRHRREVAVKVLAHDVSAEVGAERFLTEIEAAARLQHPNILPLHDSGDHEGTLFYVTPRIRGESLEERLWQQGPLGVGEAVRIAREVAGALAHAHAHGIVHRDVKPGNILLDRDGHVYLADFGIARALWTETSSRLTNPGAAVGSPTYMSPEQCGARDEIDGRSDIYGLGCVLYEMLAGSPPFEGENVQRVLTLHLTQPPPPLRTRRADVPPKLEAVVLKALAKDPSDRFSSAESMGEALESVVEEKGATAGKRKSIRRVRAFVASGVMAVVVVSTLIFAMRSIISGPGRLDAGTMICFPLAVRGPGETGGESAALAIARALERTRILSCLDGWQYLPVDRRRDAATLAASEARDIARSRNARYFLLGSLVTTDDSISVTLGLHDVRDGSLVRQQSHTDPAARSSAGQVAVKAFLPILPALLDPGRPVPDIDFVTERDPAAVALWLEGERQFRQLRFQEAFDLYQQAIALDSLLAPPALKAAQAASEWLPQPRGNEPFAEALSLARLAVRHDSLLSPRQAHLARGLVSYLSGDADEAVTHIRRALRTDPRWSEAWMALGEIRIHLLPHEDDPDSAEEAFVEALRADPSFGPPRIHLAEIRIRRGHIAETAELIEFIQSTATDSTLIRRLDLMRRCVADGLSLEEWEVATARDPLAVLGAAKELSPGGFHIRCTEDAFRTVLAGADPASGVAWGALVGLTGILLAQRRDEEVLRRLNAAQSAGMGAVPFLHLVGAAAGAAMNQQATQADDIVRRMSGESYGRVRPRTGWAAGMWHALEGNLEPLRLIHDALAAGPDSEMRLGRLAARALAAHLPALEGDTTEAVNRLAALRPTGPPGAVQWDHDEPLGAERLHLAELLLARHRYAEAHDVAAGFDHPSPLIFLYFLPRSLEIREEAARALGWTVRAREHRSRLEGLTRGSARRSTVTP